MTADLLRHDLLERRHVLGAHAVELAKRVDHLAVVFTLVYDKRRCAPLLHFYFDQVLPQISSRILSKHSLMQSDPLPDSHHHYLTKYALLIRLNA